MFLRSQKRLNNANVCILCKKTSDDFKVAPCIHIFCSKCVNKMFLNLEDLAACPICRALFCYSELTNSNLGQTTTKLALKLQDAKKSPKSSAGTKKKGKRSPIPHTKASSQPPDGRNGKHSAIPHTQASSSTLPPGFCHWKKRRLSYLQVKDDMAVAHPEIGAVVPTTSSVSRGDGSMVGDSLCGTLTPERTPDLTCNVMMEQTSGHCQQQTEVVYILLDSSDGSAFMKPFITKEGGNDMPSMCITPPNSEEDSSMLRNRLCGTYKPERTPDLTRNVTSEETSGRCQQQTEVVYFLLDSSDGSAFVKEGGNGSPSMCITPPNSQEDAMSGGRRNDFFLLEPTQVLLNDQPVGHRQEEVSSLHADNGGGDIEYAKDESTLMPQPEVDKTYSETGFLINNVTEEEENASTVPEEEVVYLQTQSSCSSKTSIEVIDLSGEPENVVVPPQMESSCLPKATIEIIDLSRDPEVEMLPPQMESKASSIEVIDLTGDPAVEGLSLTGIIA